MTDFSQMEKDSKIFAAIYLESQEILADRYQQEVTKATQNIKEEVEKSELPYLGKDSTITIIDLEKYE